MVAKTFVFSCSTPIPSVAQSAEADLWPGWYGAAEKGSGDGAGAVEADHTPPTNCTSTNGTSARRVLLPVQDPARPSSSWPPGPGGWGQTTTSQT